jgi:uncharacterized protein YdgA (DUF945 family)
MNAIARSAILTVAVIGGAVAAAPVWFGRQIEARYREGVTEAPQNPYYHLAIESYDRGWRTAESITVLEITPPEGERVVVRFNSHIEHGPWIAGLRQARIATEPVLEPEIAALFEPVFGGRPPVVAVVSVDLSGAMDGTLDSPAATAKIGGSAMNVEWKGLQSHFHVDSAATTTSFAGSIPGLSVGPTGGPAVVSIDGFTLEGSGRKGDASGLWMGSSSLELTGLTASDVSTGKTTTVTDVRLKYSTDEKDGLIQMAALLSAAQVTAGEDVVKDFQLGFSMNDIDAAVMKKFQDFVKANRANLNASPEQTGPLMLAQMQSLGGEFLVRKPSFAIDPLRFVYQGEPFSAKARVQYVGTGDVAAFNPQSDLGGSLSFEAPMSALRKILHTQQLNALKQQRASALGGGLGTVADPTAEELAEMEVQANALSLQTLQGLVAAQMLVPAGGNRSKADVTLESGRILVNGRPYPPAPSPAGAAIPE